MVDMYSFYESFPLVCKFDIQPACGEEQTAAEYLTMMRAALVEVRIQLLVSADMDIESISNDSRVRRFINRYAKDGIIKSTMPDSRLYRLGDLTVCSWQHGVQVSGSYEFVSNAIESQLTDGWLQKELQATGFDCSQPLLVLPFTMFAVGGAPATKKRKAMPNKELSESEE